MLTQEQTKQKAKLDELIKELSTDKDIVGFVQKTEKSIKTTQNHYGKYMFFLTPYASNKMYLFVISQALMQAGANIAGVNSAIMVLKGGA